ncbi:MAG: protocatechuate 3,4-dioxygenase subunit beta [Deltaproteobacteria bacterium]
MAEAKVSRYQGRDAAAHPAYLSPRYVSSVHRSPQQPLVLIPQSLSELTGPVFGHSIVSAADADLTTNAGTGAPALGERIIVSGRVIEEDGRPVPNTLLEIWQCNAAGRYPHVRDTHDAPVDPNFLGAGRLLTDAEGRYSFTSIKPGAYPWRNHYNAWRPAHIHFSLFGPAFLTRLVTQMYFPGDPLLELDGIYMTIADPAARERLVARFDPDRTRPHFALGYRFDIVLRGREETPSETL